MSRPNYGLLAWGRGMEFSSSSGSRNMQQWSLSLRFLPLKGLKNIRVKKKSVVNMSLLYQNMLGSIYPKHTPGATCSAHGVIFLMWSHIFLLTSSKTVLCPVCMGSQTETKPSSGWQVPRLPRNRTTCPIARYLLLGHEGLCTDCLKKIIKSPQDYLFMSAESKNRQNSEILLWNNPTPPRDTAGILLLLIDSRPFYQLWVWHCSLALFFFITIDI